MKENDFFPEINDDIRILSEEDSEAICGGGMTTTEFLEKYGKMSLTQFDLTVHFTINGVPHTVAQKVTQSEGHWLTPSELEGFGRSLVEVLQKTRGNLGTYEFTGLSVQPIYELNW